MCWFCAKFQQTLGAYRIMQVPLFRFAIIITFLVHPHPGILGGMIKRPQAERPAHAKASLARLYDPMGQLHTHTHTHNSHHRTSRPMGQLHTHTHKQQPPQNPWAHGSAAYTQTLTLTTTEPVGPWVSCTHTHNTAPRTSVGPWVSRTPTHTHNSHHRTSVGPWVSCTHTQPPQNLLGPWVSCTHTHTTATTEPMGPWVSCTHTHTTATTEPSWAHGSAAPPVGPALCFVGAQTLETKNTFV